MTLRLHSCRQCSPARFAVALTIMLLFVLEGSCATAATQLNAVDNDVQADVRDKLLPVLKGAGKAGRLYLDSACSEKNEIFHRYPKTNSKSPPGGDSLLVEIRETFRFGENVSVLERPDGVIRIQIGKIPSTLLRTLISEVIFNRQEQYNPSSAIDAVMNTEEVLASLQKLRLHTAPRVSNVIVVAPRDGVPHLPVSMRFLTVDDALDEIARTFDGVVIYSACKKSGWYWIDFVG